MKSRAFLNICILLSMINFMTFAHANVDNEPALIPREVLFGNPVKTTARLSPDGNHLAYLAPVNNVLNIWVKTIGLEDDRVLTNDTNRGIRYFFWAEDNKHILYAQDAEGNENWRLYGIDIEKNIIKDYTPFENIQVQMVRTNRNFPYELLISMNKENPKAQDMYHLNLESGELTLLTKNAGNVIQWIVDYEFQVRGAITALSDGGHELLVKKSIKSGWEKLAHWNAQNSMNSAPSFLGPPTVFSKDGKYIYLLDSRNANTGRLVVIEIATGNTEIIAEDNHYDVTDVLIHPLSYDIQAVAFQRARLEWHILDESLKDDFQVIAKLDHGDFQILNRDNEDKTWLLVYEKDDGPATYYIYNRVTKQAVCLFNQQPELGSYTLASMEPISFVSRDNLVIHGYLICPPGKEKKNLPLVLDVHGGPWSRNTWEYDPEAQWFANRGYACLQVNFRGSTGYGKDFLNAGDKEWGGKCHNDLVDAVNWAIEQGIADPERIAIYGGSYGGYAALVGATFTPDYFY
jgi:dipeptidyl aminopeptidase/acylaminoacyl peptidase